MEVDQFIKFSQCINFINEDLSTYSYTINMPGFVVPFVFVSGIAGLIWAIYNYKKLSEVNIKRLSQKEGEESKSLLDGYDPVSIGAIIQEGASQFILSEYKICTFFIIIMAGIVYFCVDEMKSYYTTIAFVTGAVTSMFCGAFGMKVATYSNFRTTL